MRTMFIPTILLLFCSLTQLTNASVGQIYAKGCCNIYTCFAPENCALRNDNGDSNSKEVQATTSINSNCPGLFHVQAYTKYSAQVSIVSSLQETTSIMTRQIVPISQVEDKTTDFSHIRDVSSFEFNNEISFTPQGYHYEDAIKAAGAFAVLFLIFIRRSSSFLIGCSIVLAGVPVSEGRPLYPRPPASSSLELPLVAAIAILCSTLLIVIVARNGVKKHRRIPTVAESRRRVTRRLKKLGYGKILFVPSRVPSNLHEKRTNRRSNGKMGQALTIGAIRLCLHALRDNKLVADERFTIAAGVLRGVLRRRLASDTRRHHREQKVLRALCCEITKAVVAETDPRVLSSLHQVVAALSSGRDNLLSVAFTKVEARILWRNALERLTSQTAVKYRCSALRLLVNLQYTTGGPNEDDEAIQVELSTIWAQACFETLARFRRSGYFFTASSSYDLEQLQAAGRWAELEILLAMRTLKDVMEGGEAWRPFLENNDDVIAVMMEVSGTREGMDMLEVAVAMCSDDFSARTMQAYPEEMATFFIGLVGDGFYQYFDCDEIFIDFFIRSNRILERVVRDAHAEHGEGGVGEGGIEATFNCTVLLEYGIRQSNRHPALLERALYVGVQSAARLLATATLTDLLDEDWEARAAQTFAALLAIRPEYKRWYRNVTAGGREGSACAQLGRSIGEREREGTWYVMAEGADNL